MRCCVSPCNNTSENTSQSDCITFHSFPSEVHLRAAWLRALGKQNGHLPDSAVVCSQHFLNDDIYKTEWGLRQIVTGTIPSEVQVCMICLDTDSKLILMTKHGLEETYEKLTGHPLCDRVNLKHALCVQCAQRLINFRKLRDKSLRARALMMDLVDKHELITLQHMKMINRTKHQLKSSVVLTTLGPDHCDLHILEHSLEDKQTEIGEIGLKVEVKTEESDDSMSVDGDMEVKHEEDDNVNDFVQDPLKYESATFQCTLCLEDFIHEHAYMQHMSVHLQNGEGDGVCDTSQVCKPHTAVSSSSSHSSLVTENKQADHSPSAHASNQSEVPKAEYIVPVTNITLQDKTYRFNNVSNIQYYNNSSSQKSLKTEKILLMCDICQKIFKRKSHLVKHIEAHSLVKLFPCALCEYKSNRKCNLIMHMKTHTGEKRYICKICNKKYACNSSLLRHMKTHTGEKPLSCKLCEYKCSDKWKLVRHMRTHTGDSSSQRNKFLQSSSQNGNISFICDTCGKLYKRKDQLVQHMKSHSTVKHFPCTLCDYKCNLKRSLVSHMRTHTGEKPYACNLCEYKCALKCSLNTHMRTHTGEKSYTCRICDTKFAHNGSLVRHMRTHTGEKPYGCELCEFKCAQEGNLVRHMRKHTDEKPYSCTICEYKCSDKANLDRHIRTHTGEKPYICSVCNQKFGRNHHLEMHMKTHTGIKPYSCKICKQKCATESHLEKHMRTHTGERPYACNLCEFKCALKCSFNAHIRTHTGEKPYNCTFCEYKSARSSTLSKHVRTHTGEKPYICKICNKKFALNSHLFRHMKIHSKAVAQHCLN